MAARLAPGQFTAVFARVGLEAEKRAAVALTQVALAIERQAKINASNGAHPFGTPTPATRGSGPARISGTLVRSITHTRVRPTGGGWECQVGTAQGMFPPYGKNRTPSSLYGLYLETELDYPFLEPAFHFGCHVVAPGAFASAYGSGWRQIF
jgi:hypothetical protein